MRLGIAICILTLLAFAAFASAPTHSGGGKKTFDGVGFYKNTCLGCHGSKAQKRFNPDLPEGQMIDAILNGMLMETPPDMRPLPIKESTKNERRRSLLT